MKASPRFREATAYIRLRHQPPNIKYPLLALHIAANPQAYEHGDVNVEKEVRYRLLIQSAEFIAVTLLCKHFQ